MALEARFRFNAAEICVLCDLYWRPYGANRDRLPFARAVLLARTDVSNAGLLIVPTDSRALFTPLWGNVHDGFRFPW